MKTVGVLPLALSSPSPLAFLVPRPLRGIVAHAFRVGNPGTLGRGTSASGRSIRVAGGPPWPISVRPADRPAALHLRLLRHFESVVDLDPKVADCAFQLGVPEQQLDGSKILRATVDQRRLGAAQRVRPVVGAVESSCSSPSKIRLLALALQSSLHQMQRVSQSLSRNIATDASWRSWLP